MTNIKAFSVIVDDSRFNPIVTFVEEFVSEADLRNLLSDNFKSIRDIQFRDHYGNVFVTKITMGDEELVADIYIEPCIFVPGKLRIETCISDTADGTEVELFLNQKDSLAWYIATAKEYVSSMELPTNSDTLVNSIRGYHMKYNDLPEKELYFDQVYDIRASMDIERAQQAWELGKYQKAYEYIRCISEYQQTFWGIDSVKIEELLLNINKPQQHES